MTTTAGLLSDAQLAEYHQNGSVTASGMFDAEEIDLIRRAAREDRDMDQNAIEKDDGTGVQVRLALWNHPGESIYGMVARCRRVVDSVEQILQDEAYHYHSKMIMKDAKTGGAWAWHQDYGYWYQNGVLTPNLCSVIIAVDAAHRENGCLQVLKGSHLMGRVDHNLSGDQAGADMDRVNEARKRMELVYCEMQPGDALFLHPNLLHCSARNESAQPRWSLICCYNAKSNDPYKESHHPRYTPLNKVADAAIKEVGLKRFSDDASDVAWLKEEKDQSARGLSKDGG